MIKLSAIIPLIFLACQQRTKEFSQTKNNTGNKITIAIQPFIGADSLAAILKDSLEKRVNADFWILSGVDLPVNSFYKPRKRYVADSILKFLNKRNTDYTKVIGVTNTDISTRKNGFASWGIMGLGFCPGESCIVSSFRVMSVSKSKKQFNEQMTLLTLHELGHTFSLPHCTNKKCIMRDAEGKIRFDDTKDYCSKCKSYLMKSGLLD